MRNVCSLVLFLTLFWCKVNVFWDDFEKPGLKCPYKQPNKFYIQNVSVKTPNTLVLIYKKKKQLKSYVIKWNKDNLIEVNSALASELHFSSIQSLCSFKPLLNYFTVCVNIIQRIAQEYMVSEVSCWQQLSYIPKESITSKTEDCSLMQCKLLWIKSSARCM